MKVWAFADEYRWGEMLYMAARRRGHEARLFKAEHTVRMGARPGDVAFFRIPQWSPGFENARRALVALAGVGMWTVPDPRAGLAYEDKRTQALDFAAWMPPTWVITGGVEEARRVLALELDLPFVSKHAHAAGSTGVRLIRTEQRAIDEALAVFEGEGIAADKRAELQRGYLIWQRFCAGNPYDYRVIVIGGARQILRRHNRPGTFCASGSGLIDYPQPCDFNGPKGDELRDVLTFANRFAEEERTPWVGLDLIFDPVAGCWWAAELTTAWALPAYVDAPFYRSDGTPTGRMGWDMWDVVIDELEAGRLGPYV